MFGANAFGWPYFAQAYAGETGVVPPVVVDTSGGAKRREEPYWTRPQPATVSPAAVVTAALDRIAAREAAARPKKPTALVTLGDMPGAADLAGWARWLAEEQDEEDILMLM